MPCHLPPILEWIHGSSPFDFKDFSSFPWNLGFWFNPKLEGKSLDLEKTLLETCSLCWDDPCVQVSSGLVSYSSRIKFGKEGVDFGRKSHFLETSYRILSDLTQTMSDLQFLAFRDLQSDIVQNSQTMSKIPGQCVIDSFSPTFVHCFDCILLTECPFDHILLPLDS
jgi:hypothetical protein